MIPPRKLFSYVSYLTFFNLTMLGGYFIYYVGSYILLEKSKNFYPQSQKEPENSVPKWLHKKISGADLTRMSQICPCLELSISRQSLFHTSIKCLLKFSCFWRFFSSCSWCLCWRLSWCLSWCLFWCRTCCFNKSKW